VAQRLHPLVFCLGPLRWPQHVRRAGQNNPPHGARREGRLTREDSRSGDFLASERERTERNGGKPGYFDEEPHDD